MLISLALIAGAAGQIYTVKGPNGYESLKAHLFIVAC